MITELSLKEKQLGIQTDGFSAILFPLMISQDKRIQIADLDLFFELLMFLTIIYPQHFREEN